MASIDTQWVIGIKVIIIYPSLVLITEHINNVFETQSGTFFCRGKTIDQTFCGFDICLPKAYIRGAT